MSYPPQVGVPPAEGYPPPGYPGAGYPPQGYAQQAPQPQNIYVQAPAQKTNATSEGCLAGCLGALACCCCLEMCCDWL